VLNEDNRAIAVSPGTDLVTVARYALRADRRRLVTDGVLFIVLCALVLCALIMGSLMTGGPGTGGRGLTAVLPPPGPRSSANG
jgi:hypothetical protein